MTQVSVYCSTVRALFSATAPRDPEVEEQVILNRIDQDHVRENPLSKVSKQRFSILALQPHSIHFQLPSAVDLESFIAIIELLLKSRFREQVPRFLLSKEIDASAVAARVKIVGDGTSGFES